MQNFRVGHPVIEGDLATFPSTSEDYVVTLSVQRRNGKPITEREARIAYTQAMSSYQQMVTIGKL
jgi:hypothetical protein